MLQYKPNPWNQQQAMGGMPQRPSMPGMTGMSQGGSGFGGQMMRPPMAVDGAQASRPPVYKTPGTFFGKNMGGPPQYGGMPQMGGVQNTMLRTPPQAMQRPQYGTQYRG